MLLYVHRDHKVYQLLRDGEPPRTATSDVYTAPELSASSSSFSSSSSSSSSNVALCGMIKVFELRITSTETILQGLLQTGGAQDGHLSSEYLLLLLLLFYVHQYHKDSAIADLSCKNDRYYYCCCCCYYYCQLGTGEASKVTSNFTDTAPELRD